MSAPRPVVVWGNCQAEPLADLLRAPLAGIGLDIVAVPPVFLVTEDELQQVHRTLQQAALLVTQPIREEYRYPGSGSEHLAGLLPADAMVVRFPVVFHTGPFPYQFDGHGADGGRVDAPLTDYHDLRLVAAAERGWTAVELQAWWPGPPPRVAFADLAADSVQRLQRREEQLDVRVAGELGAPGAVFTQNHPSNRLLTSMAEQVLALVDAPGGVVAPEREYLARIRTPVESAVAQGLGWNVATDSGWQISHRDVPWPEVWDVHLAFYRERPDVVVDARERHGERLERLGL